MAALLKHPIMKVQEICQQWKFPMPYYSEVPASMTAFICKCTITVEGETRTFFGKGRNKKAAKTLSAEGALAFIEAIKPHLLEAPPLPEMDTSLLPVPSTFKKDCETKSPKVVPKKKEESSEDRDSSSSEEQVEVVKKKQVETKKAQKSSTVTKAQNKTSEVTSKPVDEESSSSEESSDDEEPAKLVSKPVVEVQTPVVKSPKVIPKKKEESSSSNKQEAPAKPKGVKKGGKGKSADDEESESKEEESEENDDKEEADFIPLGSKRPQHSNGDSFSKKQKFDNAAGKKSAATLFVGNLSYDADTDALKDFLTSHGLDPTSVRIVKDSDGYSRGFGYVDFSTDKEAKKALNLNGTEFYGRPLKVDKDNMPSQSPGGQGRGGTPRGGRDGCTPDGGRRGNNKPSSTLFVKNLSYNTNEDGLMSYFGSCISARLPTDRETGKKRGYGYVEFSSVTDATKAFKKFNNKELDGRNLVFDYAAKQSGGGGGIGGHSRGRGGSGPQGRGGGGRGRRGGCGGGQRSGIHWD